MKTIMLVFTILALAACTSTATVAPTGASIGVSAYCSNHPC